MFYMSSSYAYTDDGEKQSKEENYKADREVESMRERNREWEGREERTARTGGEREGEEAEIRRDRGGYYEADRYKK